MTGGEFILGESSHLSEVQMTSNSAEYPASTTEGSFRSLSLLSAELLPGWAYKESYTFLAPDGQANVIVSSEHLGDDIDAETYAKVQGSLLENGDFSGYQQLALEPYVVPGVIGHGWLREFTWTPANSEPVQQTQIYVVAFGRGYTATATSPVSKYESYRADLAAILGSITVHAENADRLKRWFTGAS